MHDQEYLLMYVWYIIMCVWSGRELGYSMDIQHREFAGKPTIVSVPYKWLWLFRRRKNEYASNHILRVSVVCHLFGYAFSLFEVLILLYAIIIKSKTALAGLVFTAYVLLLIGIIIPVSYRYHRNLQMYYDYDWTTYFQEAFRGVSRRKCTVVAQKGDGIYEIVFGKFRKRRYVARSSKELNINDVKCAVHVYGEKGPYWVIKNWTL